MSAGLKLPAVAREKCVVLVPVFGAIEPRCDDALTELERRGYAVWRVRGYSQIDLARSSIATTALARGFEDTFWIDADMVFEPDDVDRLRERGLPLACALYAKKASRALACHVLPGTREIIFGQGGGLLEVRYGAMGFLHARREVYAEMERQLALPRCNRRFGEVIVPYFLPLVIEGIDGPWYLSESFSFCERARQCGYKIWADTTIRLGHIGGYAYTWEDAGGGAQRYGTYRFMLSDEKPAGGEGSDT